MLTTRTRKRVTLKTVSITPMRPRPNPRTLLACLGLVLTQLVWTQASISEQRPLAGERVRLVVGFGAGGGYDVYARMLAPHLEQETGATVVVENWTGGGGVVALNRLATDDTEGLTLMLVNGPSAVMGQVLGNEGVRYDVSAFTWLGRVFAEPSVILASPVSPYRSLADLTSADLPVRWASAGKTTTAGTPALVSQALKLRSEVIIGYKGTSESALAALRGEADLVAMSATSARAQAHKNGLVPIAVVSHERISLLPEVATVAEQINLTPSQNRWIDYGITVMGLGRSLATSEHVSPERREYLRRVVKKILTDTTVIREAAAQGRPIEFGPPSELLASINRALANGNEPTRGELRHVILEKFNP